MFDRAADEPLQKIAFQCAYVDSLCCRVTKRKKIHECPTEKIRRGEMSQAPPQHLTLIDTHITATLIGIVLCEVLTFASFDFRLITALIRKRTFQPMSIAYVVARGTTVIGTSILAAFTISFAAQKPRNELVLHWLRGIILPINFTSTSAVLGYRALVLHFERPEMVSRIIHLLLLAELAGGITFMTLAVADPHNPAREFSYGSGHVSPAWTTAPVAIALLIDAIFSLIVIVPILREGGFPRKGEVVHLLLSDSTLFGVFSVAVKAVAIGYTLGAAEKETNPYLPIRVEGVASTIIACRIFRGQETFLRSHREKKAHPRLDTIEQLDEIPPNPADREESDEAGASSRRQDEEDQTTSEPAAR